MIASPWNNLSFDDLRDANDIVIGALHHERLGPESSVFPDSSVVEHSTVNRMAVGSNPTRGAIFHGSFFHNISDIIASGYRETISSDAGAMSIEPAPMRIYHAQI